ncbi:TPA: hypothetical protein IAC10_06910 [Candidatus Scatousia excrementigallinarum]|uniref:Uncharacterized protein n=1 Tax=Candidatus Scatousia excrementigallinarum TaxID=2840935 RepID=A0A9D1EYQ3_9BACT|nr:hypothetical protein [Candidatus Scatousia excrementigallinarum]
MFTYKSDIIRDLTNIGMYSERFVKTIDLYTDDLLSNNRFANIRLMNIDKELRQEIMNANKRELWLSKILI